MSRHDRINIDHSDHEIYQRLTEKHTPFETMKDAFMMAAVLGFRSGKDRQAHKKKLAPFDASVLNIEFDWPIVRAIAIQAPGGGLRVIEDDDQVLTIAEEYANVGIHLLAGEVLDAPGDPVDNLLRLIERENRLEG